MSKPVAMREILGSDSVWNDLESSSKKQLLLDLSGRMAGVLGIESHEIFDVLWEREQLGTTGVGQGIAIPHGRVSGLKEVRGFFARLSSPLAFDADDQRPVDLVFLLLAPDTAGADHLHALATVSRIMRNPEFCEKIRRAPNADAIHKMMAQTVTAVAA